jgi:hypothetical protein
MKTCSLVLVPFILSIVSVAAGAACPNAQKNCPNSSPANAGGCSANAGGGGISYLKAGKPVDARTKTAITNVAGNAVTVNDAKTSKTYLVDAGTRVFVNGNSTGVERLQAGMKVVVSASLIQPTVARTIVAQNAK